MHNKGLKVAKGVLGIIIVGLIGVIIFYLLPKVNKESKPVGRYQLCQGYYTSTSFDTKTLKGQTHDEKNIFLLDTQSGEVKQYYSSIMDNEQTKGWIDSSSK